MRYPALPADIKELMELVRAGRLFDVQRWIADGKRFIPPKPYCFSPLRAATEVGFHSMVEVLLRAGYDKEHVDYVFRNLSWRRPRFDLIKLFLDFGADIKMVDMESIFRSYDAEMMSYFLENGMDVVTGNPFAHALCSPNKVQLKVYLKYKTKIPELTRQLNLALKYHAKSGSLKGVCLLMWAGADPHVRLPDIKYADDPDWTITSTALEDAIEAQQPDIVQKIGLKSERIDLNEALNSACESGDISMIETVLQAGADPNPSGSEPMEHLVYRLTRRLDPIFGGTSNFKIEEALKAVIAFADCGGRLPDDSRMWDTLRRSIYCDHNNKMWVEKIVLGFARHSVCSARQLLKFIGTQKMREILDVKYGMLVSALNSIADAPKRKASR